MSQAFFAPNKSLTGGAILASFNSKEANVYFKVAKQVNNNPDKKNFDFSTAVNFKFSPDEAAGMFRAIRSCSEFKFYHSFVGQDNVEHVTSGSLKFYSIEQDGKPPREGFGFVGKKDNQEYKCGFTLDSAERLAQYLQFALEHIFSADYAEDKRRAEEWNASKANGGNTPTAKPAPTQKPKTGSTAKPAPTKAKQTTPVEDDVPPAEDEGGDGSGAPEDSDLF